jgi:hypothetical protein
MFDTRQPSDNTAQVRVWQLVSRFALNYGVGAATVLAGIMVLVVVGGDGRQSGFAWALVVGLSLLLLKAEVSLLLLGLLHALHVRGDRDREEKAEAQRHIGTRGTQSDGEEGPTHLSTRRGPLDGAVATTGRQEPRPELAAGPIPRTAPG